MVDKTRVFLGDCLPAMREFPDKYFDLSIVDPPYGLGDRLIDGGKKGGMGSLRRLSDCKVKGWDITPTEEYFKELFRVSDNQIIWGANYFIEHLRSNDGIIIWDKMNGTNALSDAEIAWKSMNGTTRMFRMHHFSDGYDDKIHPTQKPTKLYKWLLKNYAKERDKILDTHLGSGSSRIAAFDMGFDFTGYELDKDYFEAAEKRFQQHKAQLKLDFSNQGSR